MGEEIEQVKRQRSAARSWVTRSANALTREFDQKEPSDAKVTVLIKDFNSQLDKLNAADESLQLLIEEDTVEAFIADAEKYKMKIVIPAQVLIEGREQASSEPCPSEASENQNTDARLPKLELPTFGGDSREWTSFWEQFEAAVHKTELPDVTKFSYLRTLLIGEAKCTVSGLPLTAANYDAAVELLKERYGRKEKIVFHHVQDLLALDVKSTATVKELWRFYNAMKTHVRSLEALGIGADQYGVILTPLILSRLPTELRMEWAREGDTHERDLNFLMQFLKTEIERRERSQVFTSSSSDGRDQLTAASLHVGTTSGDKKSCCVCDASCKRLGACPQWQEMTVKERRDKLFALKRCTRCLAWSTKTRPHTFKDCKKKCKVCDGPHHIVLCPKQNVHADKQTNSSSALTTSSLSSSVKTQTDVLLQTIKVPVRGKGRQVEAVVLFDTGSDKSYISKELVDKIAPEWVESKNLSFASFGTNLPSPPENRNVYNVMLQGQGENEIVGLKATCIPTICAPLSQPKVPTHLLKKLDGRQISLLSGAQVKVDILIGLDSYWKIMTGEVKFLSSDLVAQRSKLGWVLSGCVPTSKSTHSKPSTLLFCHEVPLNADIQSFWDLETIGIKEIEIENQSVNPVLEKFEKTIQWVDGRYSVRLPWKENAQGRLVNNKASAMKRLGSLSARLGKDADLRQKYNDYFELHTRNSHRRTSGDVTGDFTGKSGTVEINKFA